LKPGQDISRLFDIVSQYKELHVDDYQRSYSWGKEQIEDFFDDLKDSANTGSYHFFGTLILQDDNNESAYVVDGQQRLTTVFLLVAALRDELALMENDVLKPENPDVLPVNVPQKAWEMLINGNLKTEYRFRSSRFLQDTLDKCVFAEISKQEQVKEKDTPFTLALRKAILLVRELLKEHLDKFDDEESKLAEIDELLETVRSRFLVLTVQTSDINESLEIFITLNDRGLSLGPSDLVRGQIMTNLSSGESLESQKKINKKIFDEWEEILKNVSEPEIFFRHYLVSTGDQPVQKKKVQSIAKDRANGNTPAEIKSNSRAFWLDLLDASSTYGNIMRSQGSEKLGHYLSLLEGLSKGHRILLLTLRRKFENANLEEAVRLTWILAMRWATEGRNAQELETLYQKMSTEVRNGADLPTMESKLRSESNFAVDFATFIRDKGDSSFIGRALLISINRYLSNLRGISPAKLGKGIQLEHIAPQSATDQWKKDLFVSYQPSDDDYLEEISSLGNLTLIDKSLNIKAKQKPFRTVQKGTKNDPLNKVEHYSNSGLYVCNDLQKISKWTTTEIALREKWLLDCYNNLWDPNTEGTCNDFSSWGRSRGLDLA
jgi:hypothetical protein